MGIMDGSTNLKHLFMANFKDPNITALQDANQLGTNFVLTFSKDPSIPLLFGQNRSNSTKTCCVGIRRPLYPQGNRGKSSSTAPALAICKSICKREIETDSGIAWACKGKALIPGKDAKSGSEKLQRQEFILLSADLVGSSFPFLRLDLALKKSYFAC